MASNASVGGNFTNYSASLTTCTINYDSMTDETNDFLFWSENYGISFIISFVTFFIILSSITFFVILRAQSEVETHKHLYLWTTGSPTSPRSHSKHNYNHNYDRSGSVPSSVHRHSSVVGSKNIHYDKDSQVFLKQLHLDVFKQQTCLNIIPNNLKFKVFKNSISMALGVSTVYRSYSLLGDYDSCDNKLNKYNLKNRDILSGLYIYYTIGGLLLLVFLLLYKTSLSGKYAILLYEQRLLIEENDEREHEADYNMSERSSGCCTCCCGDTCKHKCFGYLAWICDILAFIGIPVALGYYWEIGDVGINNTTMCLCVIDNYTDWLFIGVLSLLSIIFVLFIYIVLGRCIKACCKCCACKGSDDNDDSGGVGSSYNIGITMDGLILFVVFGVLVLYLKWDIIWKNFDGSKGYGIPMWNVISVYVLLVLILLQVIGITYSCCRKRKSGDDEMDLNDVMNTTHKTGSHVNMTSSSQFSNNSLDLRANSVSGPHYIDSPRMKNSNSPRFVS